MAFTHYICFLGEVNHACSMEKVQSPSIAKPESFVGGKPETVLEFPHLCTVQQMAPRNHYNPSVGNKITASLNWEGCT